MGRCRALWAAGFWDPTCKAKGKPLATRHGQEQPHPFLLGCPTSPRQHPLHPVGLAEGGRAASELGTVRGERQRSPHLLCRSWEHVAWGRARGCSERQHPFTAGTGRAEAPVMPTRAWIWEGGKKQRAGIFLEGLRGAELALVAHTTRKGTPMMLNLVTASDNRAQTFPLSVNQPQHAQCASCAAAFQR